MGSPQQQQTIFFFPSFLPSFLLAPLGRGVPLFRLFLRARRVRHSSGTSAAVLLFPRPPLFSSASRAAGRLSPFPFRRAQPPRSPMARLPVRRETLPPFSFFFFLHTLCQARTKSRPSLLFFFFSSEPPAEASFETEARSRVRVQRSSPCFPSSPTSGRHPAEDRRPPPFLFFPPLGQQPGNTRGNTPFGFVVISIFSSFSFFFFSYPPFSLEARVMTQRLLSFSLFPFLSFFFFCDLRGPRQQKR